MVDGRLRRVPPGDNGSVHLGQLDDHADVVHGLLRLYEATFQPRWLLAARDLAERMVALFADPDGDGFFFSASDGERLVARTREVEDHPTPAGNSQAAHVLIRLADLTGDAELEGRAGRAPPRTARSGGSPRPPGRPARRRARRPGGRPRPGRRRG